MPKGIVSKADHTLFWNSVPARITGRSNPARFFEKYSSNSNIQVCKVGVNRSSTSAFSARRRRWTERSQRLSVIQSQRQISSPKAPSSNRPTGDVYSTTEITEVFAKELKSDEKESSIVFVFCKYQKPSATPVHHRFISSTSSTPNAKPFLVNSTGRISSYLSKAGVSFG